MLVASQLRSGMAIRYQGQTYKVVSAEYHPGQGKMGGVTHVHLQNLDTGTSWTSSLRADLKLDEVTSEKQTLEYLYADDDHCYFMNETTFEQLAVSRPLIGRQAELLEPGMALPAEFVEGKVVGVLFPDSLEVKVTDTAPAAHQQQDSTLKPAKLSNGIEIMVPQFIKAGDMIRLDMHNLKYLERKQKSSK